MEDRNWDDDDHFERAKMRRERRHDQWDDSPDDDRWRRREDDYRGVGYGRPLASRGSRFAARFIDGFIEIFFALPGLGVFIVGIIVTAANARPGEPVQPNPITILGGYAAMALGVLAIYIFQWYLLSTTGQTLGKRFMRVRIVKFEDDGEPGFIYAVLLRNWVPYFITAAVPCLGYLFAMVDILFIFRDDQRCIHDLLANTKVVEA